MKSYHQRKKFCEIYATFKCVIVLLVAQVNRKSTVTSNSAGAVIKLPWRVYSPNSEASVSNDGKIPGFCFFF